MSGFFRNTPLLLANGRQFLHTAFEFTSSYSFRSGTQRPRHQTERHSGSCICHLRTGKVVCMERWNDGTMERWNDGTMERWNEDMSAWNFADGLKKWTAYMKKMFSTVMLLHLPPGEQSSEATTAPSAPDDVPAKLRKERRCGKKRSIVYLCAVRSQRTRGKQYLGCTHSRGTHRSRLY